MNDSAAAPTKVECPADKDPAVRLFIGAGMCIAGAIYCFVDAVPYVSASEDINDFAEWVLHKFGPWVLGIPAVLLIVLALRALRRFITADAEGLTINGTRHAWSDFTGVDASRLEKKGILVLLGRNDLRVELDRYKYKNFKPLVALVEEHVAIDAPSEG
ncbi:MAG: hypothetical protein ACYS8X_04660 [Planctomycetota bacterium]|jgi:hypothetical protein